MQGIVTRNPDVSCVQFYLLPREQAMEQLILIRLLKKLLTNPFKLCGLNINLKKRKTKLMSFAGYSVQRT